MTDSRWGREPRGSAYSSPGFGSVPRLPTGKPGISSPVYRKVCFRSMSADEFKALCCVRVKKRARKRRLTGSRRRNRRASCVKIYASLPPPRGLFSSGAGSHGMSAWSRDGSSITQLLTLSICSSGLLRAQSSSGWKCAEAASNWKSWSRTCRLVRGEAGMPRRIAAFRKIIRATSSPSRTSRLISGRSHRKPISACESIPRANRSNWNRLLRCRRAAGWK